jgi:hypothetical protein
MQDEDASCQMHCSLVDLCSPGRQAQAVLRSADRSHCLPAGQAQAPFGSVVGSHTGANVEHVVVDVPEAPCTSTHSSIPGKRIVPQWMAPFEAVTDEASPAQTFFDHRPQARCRSPGVNWCETDATQHTAPVRVQPAALLQDQVAVAPSCSMWLRSRTMPVALDCNCAYRYTATWMDRDSAHGMPVTLKQVRNLLSVAAAQWYFVCTKQA